MRLARLFLCSALLFGSPGPLTSQSAAATPQRDPQALGVAQAALAAMGQAQALLTYRDSVATGTLTVSRTNLVNAPIVFKTKGTKMVRVELRKPEGTNIRILNQGRAVLQRAGSTALQTLLTNNTMAERVSHLPLFSLLAEWQDASINVQLVGTSQVNGQPATVVALSVLPVKDSATAQLISLTDRTLFFIDQASYAVTKIQYSIHPENDPNSDQTLEIYFGAYRLVNGIAVPFHQTTYIDGNLESELVLTSISFNVGLPDSEFAIPQ